MNTAFLNSIIQRQNQQQVVPSNQTIANWAQSLLNLIFPERGASSNYNQEVLKGIFFELKEELQLILKSTKSPDKTFSKGTADTFFKNLPEIYRKLNTDLMALVDGDPAAQSEFEIIRCYPGFFAVAMYRFAHELHLLEVPHIPRIITEYAHTTTGIDIHPAAEIGEYLYIDHGTGLVIGESTVIGNHVKLYQGVTLGALSVDKEQRNIKRHPTIGNHVIIYSGATILGGETFIGDHSVIGGNVWLTKSVPEGSTVYHQAEVKIKEKSS
ncbi:serine O-acetyltransferase [Pedobacter sp. SL55]|uniref:serine O-acetyltransferase n=1 Tax=Pedobacter sp. SL55 TaxID=2995161 RepID=UPI00226EFC9F|nr:serine acetyltransferase [Pedobacter sp. SL55]WAC40174.1 serine acetyltransferase [Pedobacter sp. SL55]